MHSDREWGTELLLRGHEGKRFHFANVVLPNIPTLPLSNCIYLWIAQLLGNLFLPLPMPCHSAFRAFWTSKCRARGNWEDHLTETKQNSMLRHISVPFDALCVCVCFTESPLRATFDMHSAWSPLGYYSFISGDLNVSIYSAFSLW